MARSHAQSAAKAQATKRIMEILKERYPKTTSSYFMRHKLGVSDRCIHRYIKCLREEGVVIDAFKGYGGGFVLNESNRRVA